MKHPGELKDFVTKYLFSIETDSPEVQRGRVIRCADEVQRLHDLELKRLKTLYEGKLRRFIKDNQIQ